ncbi:hypothetical protein [Caudoviricetes sp.]|nr:hypothetical protein [Caudoviricetes sp.]
MTISTYEDFQDKFISRKEVRLSNSANSYYTSSNGCYCWSYRLVTGASINASTALVTFDNTHSSALNKDVPIHPTDKNFIVESLFATNTSDRSSLADIRYAFNYQWIDVLCQQLGKALNTTSPQSFTANTLTRHTTGEGVMLFVLGTGSVAGTTDITFSYTNQAGVSGRTTKSVPITSTNFSTTIGLLFPVPLQDGDTGVRSVESVTVASALASAGDFGYTLIKPISRTIISQFWGGDPYGWPIEHAIHTNLGFPEVHPNACLGLLFSRSSSGANNINILKASIISG